MKKAYHFSIGLAVVMGLFVNCQVFGEIKYTITDLGSLGKPFVWCYGLNNSGQVTGCADVSGGTHAYLYSNGVMTDLGNAPLKLIQQLARHSKPEMTFNTYARTTLASEQAAADTLPTIDVMTPKKNNAEYKKTGTDDMPVDAIGINRPSDLLRNFNFGPDFGGIQRAQADSQSAKSGEKRDIQRGRRGSNPQPSDRQDNAEKIKKLHNYLKYQGLTKAA